MTNKLDNPKGALDARHYQAYGTGGQRQERLEIRRVLGATHAPDHRYMLNMTFNGNQGTELVLTYTFLIVKITGQNLQPVIAAIRDGICTYIQDYHAKEFAPSAPDAPVITTIEIIMRGEEKENEKKLAVR